MPYYLATINLSLNAKSDEDAVKTILKVLESARETKEATPYVDQIKKAANNPNPAERYKRLDHDIIKNLNIKK